MHFASRRNGNDEVNVSMQTITRTRIPRISRRVPPDPRLDRAIRTSQDYLLRRQSPEGYWYAELNGDATLEADVVMLMHFLGRVDAAKQRRLLNHVLSQQNPDGGWPIYQGGPSNINATLKAYFALRLGGHADDEPRIRSARERLLALGGIEACNSYAKFYLAMFGQYDWDKLPAMIPEIVLLPALRWGFNLYRISSWTRPIIVPMFIIYALRPRVEIPFSVRDLRIPCKPPRPPGLKKRLWHAAFRAADRMMNLYDRLCPRSIREVALDRARRWLIDRLMHPGGLAAIYPPMINAIIALRCLGYPDDAPEMLKAVRDLEDLEVPAGDRMRIEPCFSVIWDTAWAVHTLARSGLGETAAVRRGADWLLAKEIFTGGDWQVNNPGIAPAAWAFEFDNPVYPDTDDTAAVLMALAFADRHDDPGVAQAVAWLISMQNPDGGWGAFDKNINNEILEHLPWSDHNALLDPSTVDLTGRIIEALAYLGWTVDDPVIRRGVEFLKRQQEPDGSWFGRWGVNYLYGTWQVLVGLRAAGQDMREPWVRRAADWLRKVQNADGGWGETCRSYDDPRYKAMGPTTPSQTAWGLMGLVAAGATPTDPAVTRAVDHLIRTQRPDGGWDETGHTGTGFPRIFYLVYTMYRDYFPLLALQMVRHASATPEEDGGGAA
jgi:squalene-hopene/tetraprenyl-beta-curcumene cyclase